MTNDRRKTFATPLEFWQWAIMEPGKRKAKAPQPFKSVFFVQIDSVGRGELCGTWPTLVAENLPLTAVEDEHGVIPQKEDKPDELILALSSITHDAIPKLAAAIRKEIDERIAAATVERCYDNDPEWRAHNLLRLKPKGDA